MKKRILLILAPCLVLILAACSPAAALDGTWALTFHNEVNDTSNDLALTLATRPYPYTGTSSVDGQAYLDGEAVASVSGTQRGPQVALELTFFEQVRGERLSIDLTLSQNALTGQYASSANGSGSVTGSRLE